MSAGRSSSFGRQWYLQSYLSCRVRLTIGYDIIVDRLSKPSLRSWRQVYRSKSRCSGGAIDQRSLLTCEILFLGLVTPRAVQIPRYRTSGRHIEPELLTPNLVWAVRYAHIMCHTNLLSVFGFCAGMPVTSKNGND